MFDNFILIAILANAIILCQMEPLKMEGPRMRQRAVERPAATP